MIPTVARVVHYQAYGTPGGEYKSVPRAALITEAEFEPSRGHGTPEDERSYRVSLCVLNPSGTFFNLDVPFDAEGKPGTWRWPPRVGT